MDSVPSAVSFNSGVSFNSLQRSVSETSSRIRRRRRLRRLAETSSSVHCQTSQINLMRNHYKHYLMGTLLIALVIVGCLSLMYRKNEWRKFWRSYDNQYHQIVNGKTNYCDQPLDMHEIFIKIRAQDILHQDEALSRLELELRNDSSFTALAVVGASGVGKSLWARTFAAHFPWSGNVHSYAWNTFVTESSEKYAVMEMFVSQLSDCGHNLLIIDNLTPDDGGIVKCVNDMVRDNIIKSRLGTDAPAKRVFVIYIFSMNAYEDDRIYRQQHLALQDLDEFTIAVNFKRFGANELKDCILREATMENITLSEEQIQDIAASIEPSRSGCKNVHAKVLLYDDKYKSESLI